MKRTSPNPIKALCFISIMSLLTNIVAAQTCTLNMSVVTADSRCKATGSITVTVTGGSGNYNYLVTGTAFSSNTSSNQIDGLKPDLYSVKVKDVTSGCTIQQDNITIGGNYQDPRFNLAVTDVTCTNASNGSITVNNLQFGRAPFGYKIIAPSTYGTGTSNSTGVFNNLPAGDYYIQLSDSCGGLQTRIITIANYTWVPSLTAAARAGCDSADVILTVSDNKGNSNNGNPVFNGFLYGASIAPGDTVWSTSRAFRFYKGSQRTATLIVKDGCGNYQYLTYHDNSVPNVNASVNISNQVCSGFTATVANQQNLTSPQFCLYDNSNTLISCNSTGVFNSVAYGSYCIAITDNCYDTTFNRCFTVNASTPAVAASVTRNNMVCSGFDATVTGQQNLTSPQYCLYDSTNTLVTCNTTGAFTNIPYGPYCIYITDGCSGSVITRCFTQRRVLPVVNNSVSYSNQGCTTFTATINGQSNLTNPQYCIYDVNDSVITCNTTGVFNGLPYGSYCVHIQNDPACFDTTITRCFTVGAPVPNGGSVAISNKTCTDFTAKINGQQNLTNPQYCLYDSANNLITCQTSSTFNNLAFGSYCIHIQNDGACFDTTITRCFSVTQPVPVVGATVNITNRACSTYTATVTGQSNLTNPEYYLLDNTSTVIDSNTTGVFNNIAYGAYCINIVNTCYDTSFTRCFSANAIPVNVSVSSTASCNIGTTNLSVNITNGTAPYTINIYNPWGMLVNTVSSNTTVTSITGLAGLPSGYQYTIVASGACSGVDTAYVTPNIYTLTKSINANSKCPGGLWLNGSGDLLVNAQFSGGSIVPTIINKDGIPITINYSTQSGSNYTFSNMAPATYIIQYNLQTCGNIVYDTFTLKSYTYPSLDQSAVYQCNNNNFSVSAAVNGGTTPFTYEIIGSIPSSPSIIQAPQPAATFAISNGTTYSLVRLRVIDACGNATINDASILPLANTIITASADCYYSSINLTVDSVANASYTWYKKTSPTDSVLIDNNQTHTIPYLLPSDTGTYVNVMSVNSGCLQKVSTYTVTGLCGLILSTNGITFEAAPDKDNVQLKWITARSFNARGFVIERSADGSHFTAIGSVVVSSANAITTSQYLYSDINVTGARIYYRIRIIQTDGSIKYTNIVEIDKKATVSISVMPNPVENQFTIKFNTSSNANYNVSLLSTDGKMIINNRFSVTPGDAKTIQRPNGITTGVYYLVIINQSSQEKEIIKLFFK
jgi:Secretion system C-terminal sorting domain/SprB repeat